MSDEEISEDSRDFTERVKEFEEPEFNLERKNTSKDCYLDNNIRVVDEDNALSNIPSEDEESNRGDKTTKLLIIPRDT